MHIFGPKDIEVFVERFIAERAADLAERVVVDLPAGPGGTTALLARVGARVEAFDLFPEQFKVPGLTCRAADLSQTLPIPDRHAGVVWCQEAVEHLPNHVQAFREFNRILEPGGLLVVTTRNASNLRTRVSHLLAESEMFYGLMPPNEVDSVWYGDDAHPDLYFGHMFLMGFQQLRTIARITGFRIRRIHHLRATKTSVLLLPFLYPWIALVNVFAYWHLIAKRSEIPVGERREVYREQLRLALDPRILVDKHLFVELEKEAEVPKGRRGSRTLQVANSGSAHRPS